PKSNVDTIGDSNYLDNFPRFSAWWVFLLTVVTFGIYSVYWLYTRSRIINEVHHRIIPEFLIWGTIISYTVNTALSFIPDEMITRLIGITLLFSTIAYLIFFLWWLFGIRNRLQEMAKENDFPEFSLGPVMTFFFQSIYLQYKINEQLDKKVDGTTPAEPIAEIS
ncbi:MAG: DUF4234 domain-containing protein, partial [Candidatus Thiodiazotropha sp. (ex Semelilucina semeliformis)]|nr:DUF4234 domain-containing protein [Candidatus Thiodiazotropha sp. (ex Semelilucina semeliformis)]